MNLEYLRARGMTTGNETQQDRPNLSGGASVATFEARVLTGKDQGLRVASREGNLTVGTAERNDLRLTDPNVSRYHVEFDARGDRIAVRDLGSTNGTWYRRAHLKELQVQETSEFDLGRSTRVQLIVSLRRELPQLSSLDRLHDLVGQSPAMRAVFSVLERAAPTDARVLLLGESGTGKELAAQAIHHTSKRAKGPFEAVNCGSISPGTEHSELFGHRRGAFTNALYDRKGSFELAHGGTLFLDEVGELSLDLQKSLLRVLQEGAVRRVGDEHDRKVDVRLIAATNRDLRLEVNAGRFREDLYYRLSMIQVRMPPLRDRPGDLPLLVPHLVDQLRRELHIEDEVRVTEAMLEDMAAHPWPGNVRELRNHLARLMVLEQVPDLSAERGSQAPPSGELVADELWKMPLKRARELLLDRFERHYVAGLLARHETMKSAAEAAEIDRVTLHRIVNRLGLRAKDA